MSQMPKEEIVAAFYNLQRGGKFPDNEMEAGKALATMLTHFMNGANEVGERAFVKELMCTHRTLQQSVFSLFMKCIEEWAHAWEEERYDLRNEFTCKKSFEIMKGIFDGIRRAPLI